MSGRFMWDCPVSTRAQTETHPSWCGAAQRRTRLDDERESLAAVLSGDGEGSVELDNRTPSDSVKQQVDEVLPQQVMILTH